MILHKLARILNGDPNYVDSWHDIAGYAILVEDIIKEHHPTFDIEKELNKYVKRSGHHTGNRTQKFENQSI